MMGMNLIPTYRSEVSYPDGLRLSLRSKWITSLCPSIICCFVNHELLLLIFILLKVLCNPECEVNIRPLRYIRIQI